jgi:hypothetical protein
MLVTDYLLRVAWVGSNCFEEEFKYCWRRDKRPPRFLGGLTELTTLRFFGCCKALDSGRHKTDCARAKPIRW